MINIYADDAIYLQIPETPNEERELMGLPPIYQIDKSSVPKIYKCGNCGANISPMDTKCQYCGTAFYWEKENPAVKQTIDKTHKNN